MSGCFSLLISFRSWNRQFAWEIVFLLHSLKENYGEGFSHPYRAFSAGAGDIASGDASLDILRLALSVVDKVALYRAMSALSPAARRDVRQYGTGV